MSDEFKHFGGDFEEKLVQAILSDHIFAQQMMDVVDPDCFDLAYTKEIVAILRAYFRQYENFPSVEILKTQLISDKCKIPALQKKCRDYIDKIQDRPLNGDSDYVKDKSLQYFRTQSLKNTIINDIVPMLKDGKDLEKVVPIIEKAISKGTDKNVGLEYDIDEKRFLQEEYKFVPSPWDYLNSLLGGGWGSKRLTTVIGGSGSGKSHLLVNVGAGAIEAGKTVVHYTLELDDIETARRYDACLTGVDINDIPQSKARVLKLLKEAVTTGKLIIKEYPMMTATVQTIKAHLGKLRLKDIHPDIIIIDYGDLLVSVGAKEERLGLKAVWQDLKKLAQELEIPVVTATQTNRAGVEKEIITPVDISEDFSKVMTSDIILTMARNMEQKMTGIGNMYLAKNRQGRDGQVFQYKIDTAKCSIAVDEKFIQTSQERAQEIIRKVEDNKNTADALKDYLNNIKLTQQVE